MSAPAPAPTRLDRDALDREPAPRRTTARGRVRLRFLPDGAEVRVPSGTPVFDAASWNGIAIDSTCGGHGTCKKCKVRVVSGDVPVGALDPRAFSPDGAARGMAARVPRAGARERPRGRGAAAADAAEGGARRRRAPRDPAPVGAEAPPRARGADAGGPALGPPARARRDRRPRAARIDRAAARRSAGCCDALDFDVTAVVCDEELIDIEPGDTTARRFAIAFDLGTTTVVATLLDLDSGQPRRGALDAQPPAAVRRRRDHADLGDDDGRQRARRRCATRAHETLGELTARGLRRGRASTRARCTRSPSAAT